MELKNSSVILKEASSQCLLCGNKNCSAACKSGVDAAKILRSLRFENYSAALFEAKKNTACLNCNSRECESSCLKDKISFAVPVQKAISTLLQLDENSPLVKDLAVECDLENVSLETEVCGVKCENPFFLSSSVVGSNYEMVSKALRSGWAGVSVKTVAPFISEEVSPRFSTLKKEADTFVGFKNLEQLTVHSMEENVDFIRRLKKDFPSKVVIANIMGRTEEEWEEVARIMTEAGADVIECNFSCPNMAIHGTGSDVGQDPDLVAKYTKAVRRGSNLPILAKMTPNIGNMEIPALAAIDAGADGIAAINTIKSVMNVDLSSFLSEPKIAGFTSVGGYSGKAVKPIALRFINDMKKCEKLKNIPISGMGGIETWRDAVEFIAMGCESIQVTTAVMQYGYGIVEEMIDGTKRYMAKNGFKSIKEIVGRSLDSIIPTDSLDRKTKEFPKFLRDKCIGCQRCITSCFDGGHQALELAADGKPRMNKNCVGCQLCVLVCPNNAIVSGTRVKV